MRRILSILSLSLTFLLTAVHGENVLTPQISWTGYKGAAIAEPAVSSVKGPDSKSAVHIEALGDGAYQGALGKFPEAIDFDKYGAIEFYIRHNLAEGKDGRHTMSLMTYGKKGRVHCKFVTPSYQWNKISIPLDKSSFESAADSSVNLNGIDSFRLFPFANMNSKGEYLEIADFKLIPKKSGNQKLTVMSYTHKGQPNSGESGNTLIDGDKLKNIFYRQFSDDPFITFDLGGRFAVDQLEVSANAAPSHNFAEITIFASLDNKDFYPAGALRNTADGTDQKLITYTFKSSDKPLVGRYIRLTASRPRSDFPVNLSEVEFFGHPASEAEIARSTELNYDSGVKMPPRNDKDYAVFESGNYKFYISRANGVINGIFYKNKLIVERMTPEYTLQTRKSDTVIDGNADKVVKINTANDRIAVTVRNTQLPDLEICRTYYVVNNALFERVEVTDLGMKERKFLRMATNVILEQNFRKDGFYEMPGSALAAGMLRLSAAEVQTDRSLTNIPTIAFENAATRQVIWHTRFKFNDRFTYMDIGTEEENLQIFKPNGWRITSATIVPMDRRIHSFENRFSVTDGGMLKSYDEYISTPEAAAFRSQIVRPQWLRDLRCVVSQGWDAMYPGSNKRQFLNINDAFSPRGYLYEGMMFDMDSLWGELPISGDIVSWCGGIMSAEDLRQKLENMRSYVPQLKCGYYSWFWSAFPWSEPVKKHPEWFVRTLRSGAQASWFPGVNVNVLRFWGIPESREDARKRIVDFVNYYNQDGWYLDGGKSGVYAKDWESMRIDDPLGWTDFYLAVRKSIQENNPDRIVFFNHSENPIGDAGFLESFGATLTSEWRRGAILMWKFRMYAYKDPMHHSVYIYWLPAVDGAFHNYMTGIGVVGSYGSRDFDTRDLPFIAARYEIRQAQITDADVQPDWRLDFKEDVECMTLHQGNNGWIFINPHIEKPVVRNISALTAPMNIKDAAKPIYAWLYTIKDGRTFKARFSEKAVAADYQQHGWISERAVVPNYLGKFPYTERFAYDVPLKVNEAQVLMLSQIPAVILSIDNEPSHYYLSGQPGLDMSESDGKITVDSEYAQAEIGLLLEDNTAPAEVKINGQVVPASVRIEKNMRFAVVKVGQGQSVIEMTTCPDTPVDVQKLRVDRYNRILAVYVTPENSPVEVYCDGNLVMNRTGSFRMAEMPDTVQDGEYTFKAGDKTQTVKISNVGKPLKLRPILIPLTNKFEVKEINRSVRGVKVLSQGTVIAEGASAAEVDVDKLKLTAQTQKIIESHYNRGGAMMEFAAKRYLKVRIDNGFWHYNNFGMEPKRHSVRAHQSNVFAGLIFDFSVDGKYSVRSAAGLGVQNEKRAVIRPDNWGKKDRQDYIYMLDNLLVNEKLKEKTAWIDLQTLGAPDNWDGNLMMTVYLEDISPARSISVEILSVSDELPAGEEIFNPIELGRVSTAVLEVKKVSGKPDWSKIPVLGELSPIKNTMTALKTKVKAAWDDENLYLHYQAEEIAGRALNSEGGKSGRPWYGDGIEFFVQRTDKPEMLYHALIDVGNVSFCEDIMVKPASGSKSIEHAQAQFKSNYTIKDGSWTADVVMPWSTIGKRPAVGALSAFNMMRNRMERGAADNYSLAPGSSYFSGKRYQIKLTE